ncbi:MAG: bifunctional ornithine acetyltransferase/N-acetylglutamate synthase, partial [Eggerthellaceae bacterium]|nr:bifunctional ornithine acetyltransferase/N-acetylglutamate synthase [Eggerthellaceae bacterium]
MSEICEEATIEPLDLQIDPIELDGLTELDGGGVTSAAGFSACGIHAGFRADPNRLDMALLVADDVASCAATFTQNVFCAAPVTVSREHLDGVSYGMARALVVNSGCANAATGDVGLQAAQDTSTIVGDAIGCPSSEVLVASTGVIGVH